ncbi:hypothetical protein Ddye_031124 [Dipteronia dyeriana]|uniref:Uncharacterized protein n=1 Tax=Dipteronia dyeriana TaxID=168575 RepID=A0AAD9WN72_9ROSI|nr:hypothetical protein Ddye_031124 [Dipteronia dyeriana]
MFSVTCPKTGVKAMYKPLLKTLVASQGFECTSQYQNYVVHTNFSSDSQPITSLLTERNISMKLESSHLCILWIGTSPNGLQIYGKQGGGGGGVRETDSPIKFILQQ